MKNIFVHRYFEGEKNKIIGSGWNLKTNANVFPVIITLVGAMGFRWYMYDTCVTAWWCYHRCLRGESHGSSCNCMKRPWPLTKKLADWRDRERDR